LALIDNSDVSSLYAESDVQTQSALAALREPDLESYADEASNDHVPSPSGLHVGKYIRDYIRDTPLQIIGVTSIRTRALVGLLNDRSANAALIDVGPEGAEMLPGASHFANGGFAFDDAKVDSEYQNRFDLMLHARLGSLDTPVILYAEGPQSWLSVNASMRASRLGYRHVYWYRGGVASWRAAKLPLVTKVPVAAIY
jgi:rhodanese-related sulfurtransferase